MVKPAMEAKTLPEVEKKKEEARALNAQLHAAIFVAGVASAIAAMAPATVALFGLGKDEHIAKTDMDVASVSILVVTQCVEAAEAMEAEREHLVTVVNSAMNIWSAGDIMTLTTAAATRGASLRHHPQGRLHLSLLPTNPKHSSSFSRSLSVEQTDALLEMALLKWKLASWMTKRDVELFLS
ncbi:hypothetical protein C1H46_034324 [Malus baccata]|uniref:VAN3-binding protein-like auxin canalisation domain-containing protein n=1 Tax=Malus baccata TaxID=106549 RepID=A0A540L0V9_MALBA|nr:hypothetical protein C1H46_034324 [Malus baccata]